MRLRRSLGLAILCSSLACAAPRAASPGAAAEPSASASAPPPSSVAPGNGAGSDVSAAPAPTGAAAILARADLEAYHGWIRYLMFRAQHDGARFGEQSEAARQAQAELATWTQRILDDRDVLSSLRGVFEWAHLSPVDDSGQPFRINVPTDYAPGRPVPLVVYMHGLGGNHLEHSSYMKERTGDMEVAVLGRSRGGYYRALSEADVLGVIEYIRKHFAIDASRIHLEGGSMGGGGTFWIGSRHPHRFASGRPVCGFASDVPLENLLTLPLYATHSADDWVVPVLQSRGPIARLRELGADAVLDETTGYGHAVWNYTEGNERGDAWYVTRARPASKSVKRLSFTALDGGARRDYWAEIAEWGPSPAPARFSLEARADDELAGQTENVTRLAIHIAESPFDRARPLALSLDGVRLTRAAPLPERLWLVKQGSRWSIEDAAPAAPTRLHTPGGANQLYDGVPLLIVYGTRSPAATDALRAAASVASRSSNAAWPSPSEDTGPDGVPLNQNLYGELRVKADVDVTAAELASHHLVLIGTAEQNALVARMAERLPVRHEGDVIRFSDGTSLPAQDTALGLVHYDPLAPSRLIFWVASPDVSAYRADALVPRSLGGLAPTGADLVITRVSEPRVVMARSFDSRWQWLSREGSAPLPAAAGERAGFARLLAESVRRAAGADFALALETGEDGPTYAPETLRASELAALIYHEPIAVMSLTGSELATARLALVKRPEAHLEPEPGARLEPRRSYRVALTARQITPLVHATHLAPRNYRLTELDLASTLARSGLPDR